MFSRKRLFQGPAGIGTLFSMAALCILTLGLMGCPGPEGPPGPPGDDGEPGPAGPSTATGPGLTVVINEVAIPADLRPEVTFTATDDFGVTVGLDQFVGSTAIRFTMAYLENSGTAKAAAVGQYFCYVTDPDNGQATYDHNLDAGLSENADGTITYKFETVLPADYDATATHQVGGQLARTLPTGGSYSTNVLYTWIPAGGDVVETREISTTETCNACHTKLTVHGSRTEYQYCILCHTPQTVDPDTGNSVDMPWMIHQIHMGANLPSGNVYEIIGYRDSLHEYSNVHMPQSVTNCTACHADGPHADAWNTNPTAVGCLSCHDDVDVAAGVNHMATTADCTVCHSSEAIIGYHTWEPVKLVLETVAEAISVTDEMYMSFDFSASDSDGNPILDLEDITKYTVGYLVGWPTSDYTNYVDESGIAANLVNHGDGTYSFTSTSEEDRLPEGSTDSFGFIFRGRSIVDGARVPMVAPSPVYFRLDGGEAEARRTVVTDEKCAACHGEPFAGHGSDRIGVQVCIVCHNPNLVSEPDEGPTVTVNMKDMIHLIHTGAELEGEYTTGGHSGDVDFTEIHFPGRREQCTICHEDGTQALPLADGLAPTIVEGSVTPPATAACTTCHDGVAVAVHAMLATYEGIETCAICHGSGAAFDVEAVHHVD